MRTERPREVHQILESLVLHGNFPYNLQQRQNPDAPARLLHRAKPAAHWGDGHVLVFISKPLGREMDGPSARERRRARPRATTGTPGGAESRSARDDDTVSGDDKREAAVGVANYSRSIGIDRGNYCG